MVDLETAERLATDGIVAVEVARDLLTVAGPDAASYLQGQISQDAEGLAIGSTTWTLLLQPQGKVDAWLRMHRLADDRFLLDVDAGHGEGAKARLERFKLRVDATIELASVTMLALRGPGSSEAAQAVLAGSETGLEIVGLDASWAETEGVDLVALDGSAVAPGTLEVGPSELLDVIRISRGQPAMGHELDESTIPAAAGIVDESVDFTKGCYVGQELVARIDSRGNNTPTRLYGLQFDGAAPAVGAELQLDGAAVGTVTSVVVSPRLGPIGLGYLKRSVEVPATLAVSGDDGTATPVRAVTLPMASD